MGERLFKQALERENQAPQIALPLTQDHTLIREATEYGGLYSDFMLLAAGGV